MKRLAEILIIAAMIVGCAVSCDLIPNDNGGMPVTVSTDLPVTSCDVEYQPVGGTGTIVTAVSGVLNAVSDKQWCTVDVSGSTVNVTVEPNVGKESRYALVTLSSEGKIAKVSLLQFGELLIGFDEFKDVAVPVSGEVFTYPVEANVPVEITSSVPWIHTVFADGLVTITVDENDQPETRTGSVSFNAGSASGVFNVMQYPGLKVNDSWILTPGEPRYVYPEFAVDAAVTGTGESLYALFFIPKSKVEGKIDDYLFETLVPQTRQEILDKVEQNPGSAFKDYLSSGDLTETFKASAPGDFYLAIVGFGENGYITGQYKTAEVVIGDVRPAYYKWIGVWKVDNGSFTEQWTISIDEANLEKRFIIRGINSHTNTGILAANGDLMYLTYNASDGTVSLTGQNGTNTFEYGSYGECYLQLLPYYLKQGSTSYTGVTGSPLIFKARLADDANSADMYEVGTRTNSGITYTYVGFRLRLYAIATSKAYTLSSTTGLIPLPLSMTRVVE